MQHFGLKREEGSCRQYAVSVLAQPRDPNSVCMCVKVSRVIHRIRDLERISSVQY